MNNSPKNPIQSLRNYFGRSIRRRLILGITIVNLFIFTVFMLFIMDRQQSFLHAQSIEQANSLAHALAVNSTPWVISDDIQGLSELIASLTRYPELRYLMILSPQGKVLGHTRNENVGLYVNDPTSQRLMNAEPVPLQLVINRQIVDVAVPIQVNNILVGWSRVCLGQENVRAASENILKNGAIYVLIAMLPTFLIAYFMALGIGRGLHHLVTVADAIRKGARDVRVSLNRDDEIGRLGNDFNQMLNSIVSHEKAINLAHEELEKHKNHLEELVKERTKELEAFTYSVSHDLRAPLRAMEGFSQALLEDYADRLDPVGQDYAHRIAAAAQHMDILIQDLLGYSRLSRIEIKLRPVVLEGVVQEALSLLTPEIQEKSAQVAVERPLPRLVGHHGTLVQVVGNLLSNAIKFVAPGVKPQVRVWAETIADCGLRIVDVRSIQQSTVPKSEIRNAKWVRLWVEDNGIGIAPEHHELIFRIFERLHAVETYPGTGVGLAIVRKGMERMGGRVGVESEPGRGSRFWVELPRSKT